MKYLNLKSGCLIALFWSYAATAAFYPINSGMINQVAYVTAAAGVTTLTKASNQIQVVEGSTTQTVKFPDATTLPIDWWLDVVNNSTGAVTVNDSASSLIATVSPGQIGRFFLKARASAAGTWKKNTNASTADLANYYLKSEFIATSAGAGDAGKPIKTNGSGVLDNSFLAALSAAITELTGDVTAGPGSGSQAATVAFVGGKTAAAIAQSVTDTTAATAANTNGAIVKRDGSGNFAASTVTASLTGTVTGHSTLDLPLLGGTMGGAIAMGTNKITGVGDPTAAQDAATKSYVDVAVSNGGVAKDASKYATTAALATVIYANGASGVGATLTAVGLGALSLDGNTPSVGDRVLVKNQVSTFQNGIYTVTTVGNVGVAFVLTRATDYDQAAEALSGASTYVSSGTANASTVWDQSSANVSTMGTDAITFAQTAGPGSVTAGTGITVTGTAVSITATGVGASSCTNCNLSYNAQGQITTASNGTAGGAAALSVVTKTSSYQMTNQDDVVLMSCTSSNCTVTMQSLTIASSSAKMYRVKNVGSWQVIVQGSGIGLSADMLDVTDSSMILPPGGLPQSGQGFIPGPVGGISWSVW